MLVGSRPAVQCQTLAWMRVGWRLKRTQDSGMVTIKSANGSQIPDTPGLWVIPPLPQSTRFKDGQPTWWWSGPEMTVPRRSRSIR